MSDATWVTVTTTNADIDTVVRFAAHHLAQGADRIILYLDDPMSPCHAFFQNDSTVTTVLCDDTYWAVANQSNKGTRPKTIEGRQKANLNNAISYLLKQEAPPDWVTHIDIDEFILPKPYHEIGRKLGKVPEGKMALRMRPIENLISDHDGEVTYFKALVYPFGKRKRSSPDIYPQFGTDIPGGFLSHTVGKSFFRLTKDLAPNIHLLRTPDALEETQTFLGGVELAHMHTKPWEAFWQEYQRRRSEGSYRNSLAPDASTKVKKRTLKSVLTELEDKEGQSGIRRLYDELCVLTPELETALRANGVLREVTFQFDTYIALYFPHYPAATPPHGAMD